MNAKRGRVSRAWRSWVALLAEREGPETQAVFRALVGVVLFGAVVTMWDEADVLWVDVSNGGAFTLGPGGWLVRLLGGPTSGVIHGIMVACALAAACVAVGVGGRVATFVAGQLYLALFSLNYSASGGYDLLITNALWLLTLGQPTAALSIDALVRRTRAVARIPAWPRRMLVFQIVVVYFATGLQKLSPVWTPAGGYSALYWVFQEPTWRRFDMSWTASLYPLTQVATFVTWHFEVLAPLLLVALWLRRTRTRGGRLRLWASRFDPRKPFAAIGFCLHVGILVALNVGPFSWISLAYYVCLARPTEVRRMFGRLRRPAQPPAQGGTDAVDVSAVGGPPSA
jgi:hypothetical protein